MSEQAERVRAAVARVLRDFQSPTPVDPPVWIESSGGDEMVRVASTGYWVQGDLTGDELLVDVAFFLKDQVFSDGLAQTWGEARPPCPGHQHPADTALLDGQAWWRCPHSHERLGRIGALG